MSQPEKIAVFGAGGSTGAEVLKRARKRGLSIRALEHSLPKQSERIAGFEYVKCDVLQDDLSEALEGCDAVISALGVAFGPRTAINPPPLYTEGTRNIVKAMDKLEAKRIAVISAAFVEHQPSVPAWFELTAKPALANILEQMRAMEAMLQAHEHLQWTAARPGWLLDEPFTGEAVVSDERLAEGCFRCRHADLAECLIDFICENSWLQAKPAIGKPEAGEFESLAAVKSELELDL
ncbi:MAG: NAD(P)H-binding protein [Pseudomonadota bacterium]